MLKQKRLFNPSADPDFWDVWTGNSRRPEIWAEIAKEWQGLQEIQEENNE